MQDSGLAFVTAVSPRRGAGVRRWVAEPVTKVCTKCGRKRNIAVFTTRGGTVKARCDDCRRDDRALAMERREHLSRTDVRNKLLALRGGECSRCGYHEFNSALCFHHTVGVQKEGNVSDLVRNYCANPTSDNWDRVTDEADKCIILCASCHWALHAGEWTL